MFEFVKKLGVIFLYFIGPDEVVFHDSIKVVHLDFDISDCGNFMCLDS